MTATGNRRSTIAFYSDADPLCWNGLSSHRVRIVLSEKNIKAELITVASEEDNEELNKLSPYGACPALVDRELALYDQRVIIDYLDERYPHPPLMPVDPVSRARTRLALHRIESDWYSLVPASPHQHRTLAECQKELATALMEAEEVFASSAFFLGETYSILDAALAALLWRLPAYGIVLPDSAVTRYSSRLFSRAGFTASLSDSERDLAR